LRVATWVRNLPAGVMYDRRRTRRRGPPRAGSATGVMYAVAPRDRINRRPIMATRAPAKHRQRARPAGHDVRRNRATLNDGRSWLRRKHINRETESQTGPRMHPVEGLELPLQLALIIYKKNLNVKTISRPKTVYVNYTIYV